MKLASYKINNQSHLGALTEHGIVDLHQASGGEFSEHVLDFFISVNGRSMPHETWSTGPIP